MSRKQLCECSHMSEGSNECERSNDVNEEICLKEAMV